LGRKRREKFCTFIKLCVSNFLLPEDTLLYLQNVLNKHHCNECGRRIEKVGNGMDCGFVLMIFYQDDNATIQASLVRQLN
jgi:hypothetical protein